ncbi:MAG: LysR family transcriptional regulator [Candidatus Wenzhouxiangella sp. M2_3B_020]
MYCSVTKKEYCGLDTLHLETLRAVGERGSLAAAAQDLNITPNAVAQRIRALEKEFGVALVARAGRHVQPTRAGHAVLRRLPNILRDLRDLHAAATGEEISGELRIGAISTALTGILPEVLERLAHEHPRLRLHLEPGTSGDLYKRTRDGDLDAAAVVEPSFELPKFLSFRLWRREPLTLLVPESEKRDDATEILRTEPVIIYDRAQWGGRLAAQWLEDQRLEIRTLFELDALDAIAVLVARGLGVAVVPDWVGPRPADVRLRQVALPPPVPERGIGLLYPQSGARAHLVDVLLKQAERTARG